MFTSYHFTSVLRLLANTSITFELTKVKVRELFTAIDIYLIT